MRTIAGPFFFGPDILPMDVSKIQFLPKYSASFPLNYTKILKGPSDFFIDVGSTGYCLNTTVCHLPGPRFKLEINDFKKRAILDKNYGCHGNNPLLPWQHVCHKKSS